MSISESRLSHLRVRDAMHTGILTTDPTTPLEVVARLMAESRVHAVAVADPDHTRRPWGFVSALDVAAAVAGDKAQTAGEAASHETVAVSADTSVESAAATMVEHGLGHLIVVEAATGHPCGIISALDVAAAYGR